MNKKQHHETLRPPGALNSDTNITEYSGVIGRRDINAMIIWH